MRLLILMVWESSGVNPNVSDTLHSSIGTIDCQFMTQQTDRLGYDTKSTEYFQVARAEMLRFVPANCRRVLDVGCAEGAFGESLKKTLGIEVWGVEPTKSAAAKAMPKLDRVIEGDFGPEVDLPVGTFDCIFSMMCSNTCLLLKRRCGMPGVSWPPAALSLHRSPTSGIFQWFIS